MDKLKTDPDNFLKSEIHPAFTTRRWCDLKRRGRGDAAAHKTCNLIRGGGGPRGWFPWARSNRGTIVGFVYTNSAAANNWSIDHIGKSCELSTEGGGSLPACQTTSSSDVPDDRSWAHLRHSIYTLVRIEISTHYEFHKNKRHVR